MVDQCPRHEGREVAKPEVFLIRLATRARRTTVSGR
jgi:hypothetical protein